MSALTDISDKVFAAFNAHDPDTLYTLYAPDVVVTSGMGTERGRDAVRLTWEGLFKGFPDVRISPTNQIEGKDAVVVQYMLSGTNTGPLFGGRQMPPTGKSINVRGVSILTIAGGKVASETIFTDQMGMMTQLGLMQPPGGGPPPS